MNFFNRLPEWLQWTIAIATIIGVIVSVFVLFGLLNGLALAATAGAIAAVAGFFYALWTALTTGQSWAIWTSVSVTVVCCVLPLLGLGFGIWKINH